MKLTCIVDQAPKHPALQPGSDLHAWPRMSARPARAQALITEQESLLTCRAALCTFSVSVTSKTSGTKLGPRLGASASLLTLHTQMHLTA